MQIAKVNSDHQTWLAHLQASSAARAQRDEERQRVIKAEREQLMREERDRAVAREREEERLMQGLHRVSAALIDRGRQAEQALQRMRHAEAEKLRFTFLIIL